MNQKIETAVFGGGCFWCTEAVFKMLRGVVSVLPGYAGGSVPNPTYDQICGGQTGHAEVTRVEYDPSQINYDDLLTVFFASHDPTTLNRQGNDVGSQYRSVVFYTTPEQKLAAEKMIDQIDTSHSEGGKVVTLVEPLDQFYPAEQYHRDYYANNSDQPYCQIIINPKLRKVKEKFAQLLKGATPDDNSDV